MHDPRAIGCTTPVQYTARLINSIPHLISVCQPTNFIDKYELMFYNMYSRAIGRIAFPPIRAPSVLPFFGGRLCAPLSPHVAPKDHLAQYLRTGISMSPPVFAVIRLEMPVILPNTDIRSTVLRPSPAPCISPLSGAEQEGQGRRLVVGSGRWRSELPLTFLLWSATMSAQERGTLSPADLVGAWGLRPHYDLIYLGAKRPPKGYKQ